MASLPSVSVLVLNRNGREHLEVCLASLAAQEYPDAQLRIEVVDNGSTDGSIEFVRQRFPRVQVLDLETNLGFSAAYNIAVERAGTEYVAVLNNDTRVDPRWLIELTSAASRHGASAVASKILDWTGERIDFVGGIVSFLGHAWQRDFREPATDKYEEQDLLFWCGASALVNRKAYIEAGGFDPDFFSYFEDVDLGWRMNLLGHRIVLAPRAITYHRLHGSWSRLAFAQRLRLFERNALAMIYKNYEAGTLERILPAAVALSLARGLNGSGIDTLLLDFQTPPPPAVDVEQRLVAHLIALEDFCGQLPVLAQRRKIIQASRRRSDADLFPLFVDPFRLHETGTRYEEIARALIRDFAIEDVFRPSGFRLPGRTTFSMGLPRERNIRPLVTQSDPDVSVVILTALGTEHLEDCLTSLRAQNYPEERCEVIIVDNGSQVPVGAEVQTWFPGVRVVRCEANLGFARGNNVGAKAATGRYLVFLNDDTRVHPDWLRELTGTARRRNAAAVAACMLDWKGRTVDFVGGTVNFEGKGFQNGYGTRREKMPLDESPLLFACGGAAMIDRSVFIEAGGWDDDAFAYFEDVELGWRLNLFGHQVWFSPGAVVYHKHHGTSGRWADAPRTRLFERNSLRMVYTMLEERSLARVLPSALLLAADRAILLAGLSRASVRGSRQWSLRSSIRILSSSAKAALRSRGITRQSSIGGALSRLGFRGLAGVIRDTARNAFLGAEQARTRYLIEQGNISSAVDGRLEQVPLAAAATLSGIFGFLNDLPQLTVRRHDMQQHRVLTDSLLLQRFGAEWTRPCGSVHPSEHHARQRQLVELFGIADLTRPVAADRVRPTGSERPLGVALGG